VGEEAGTGPFNAAQAFNNAFDKATGDVVVTFGADHLPDVEAITAAVEIATETGWAPVFTETREYTPEDTEHILNGANPNLFPTTQMAPFCIAIIACHRSAWIPFDERFNGWGSEDTAWRLALTALHGEAPKPAPRALRALWHPPASKDHADANFTLLEEYVHAANHGIMRQHLETLGVL
jgi:hypothetical protein